MLLVDLESACQAACSCCRNLGDTGHVKILPAEKTSEGWVHRLEWPGGFDANALSLDECTAGFIRDLPTIETSPARPEKYISTTADNAFGIVIHKARQAKGLTQKNLAKICNQAISSVYVSQIEKGERVPSPRVCLLLAHALELDEKQLMIYAFETKYGKMFMDFLQRKI